jgi:hypothetical protein
MNRLTPEERRRVHLAQQRARERMLARVHAPAQAVAVLDQRSLRRLMTAVAIAMLLGGGLLASQTFDFHPPASLVEALLPRL